MTLMVCAAFISACASRHDSRHDRRHDSQDPASIDDPKFVSWYKAATPYARTTFFITLCAAQGFSNGSIEINLCLSNMRRDARVRVEGRL